jgi:hypothetical protein
MFATIKELGRLDSVWIENPMPPLRDYLIHDAPLGPMKEPEAMAKFVKHEAL